MKKQYTQKDMDRAFEAGDKAGSKSCKTIIFLVAKQLLPSKLYKTFVSISNAELK